MTTPADLSTKLKAVNVILAGSGETAVESLDAGQSSLGADAELALDETSRTLQTKGWYWNSETGWPLSPDADGNLMLPGNTLSVSRVANSGGDILVQRGRRLYNRSQRTYTFPQGQSVDVDLVVYLSWDDLPEFAKQAIIYVAQRRFQMRGLTSTAIDAAIEDDLQAAMATLEQREDAQGPANSLTDSPEGLSLQGQARRR